ncbi:MAG TPA: WD40 repeat domain-containing protein [bacterium]
MDDEENLQPPLGMVFTIAGGQVAEVNYFNLSTMDVVATLPFGARTVMASVMTPNGDKLAIADGRTDELVILQMPRLQQGPSVYLGGEPTDIDMDINASHLFAITHNGNFWIDSVGIERLDTLEVRLYPRRMAVRPPGRSEAWVVCPGNEALHVISLLHHEITYTETFEDMTPVDVQFSPCGAVAYVAFAGMPGSIVCYDADSLRPLSSYEAGPGPFDLAVSDDSTLLAASDSLSGTVTIWNLADNRSWTVRVGAWAGGLQFEQHSHTLYVMAVGINQIMKLEIGPAGPQVIDSLRLPQNMHNMILWERHY